MISQNLRMPRERIQDLDPNAAPGVTISTPPVVLGANSEIRLIAACKLMRYNARWSPVIRSFKGPMEGLKQSQKG